MSLVEIARFQDVYEADLAAAFLASHGVEVDVTERFQTTVDPLMQRALGLLTPHYLHTPLVLGDNVFYGHDLHKLLASADGRLRLGIGHPGSKPEVVNWVLKKPSLEHRIAIEQAIDHSLRVVPDILAGQMEKAMRIINSPVA